jgi:hypothetical protein
VQEDAENDASHDLTAAEARIAELEEALAEAEAEAEADTDVKADVEDEDEDETPAGGVAAEDPPFDGYDELKGPQVVKLIKGSETDDEDVQAILDYEKTHANRRGVVGAAEVALGDRGNPE